MREIAELSKQIRGEVAGVCDYAKSAVDYKKIDPALAEVYYKIANVEMTHVNLLHEQVMRKIAEAEKSGVDYPQFMRDKWEDQHKEIISKMAEAKVYLGLYK